MKIEKFDESFVEKIKGLLISSLSNRSKKKEYKKEDVIKQLIPTIKILIRKDFTLRDICNFLNENEFKISEPYFRMIYLKHTKKSNSNKKINSKNINNGFEVKEDSNSL